MKNNLHTYGVFSEAFPVCANFNQPKAVREVCTGREVFFSFYTRIIAILLLIIITGIFVKAQTPSLSIGNMGVCDNNTISVPLTGNNLNGISALTLFINYNEQELSFSAIENIDPQLSGLIYNTLANPSRIAIVWSKIAGATFINTPLLYIKFNVMQKNSLLTFAQDFCEIADISIPPQLITPQYNNGSVFNAAPVFSSEPENKTIAVLSDASFHVFSPNTAGYAWQESRSNGASWTILSESGIYNGTATNILRIKNVPANFNQFRYRCTINRNGCNEISREATLSVDSITGINPIVLNELLQLSNNPNPFSTETTISYVVPESGFVTIKIFSMTGQLMEIPVEQFLTPGDYRIKQNFVSLPRGIYFCQYVFRNAVNVCETNRKMIKIS